MRENERPYIERSLVSGENDVGELILFAPNFAGCDVPGPGAINC